MREINWKDYVRKKYKKETAEQFIINVRAWTIETPREQWKYSNRTLQKIYEMNNKSWYKKGITYRRWLITKELLKYVPKD